MSDEATGGILQALEPRLAEIERRQDDLDVVVLETATMAKTLKDERDDARSAAQVQAGEIARMTAELQRAHEAGERMQAEVARLSLREPTNDEMERALAGGDEAFLVGTIRRCRHCRCAVFGGPTACVRCADRADLAAAVKRATALESANALGSAQVTQLQEELADTTAKLGRAVAALRKHRIDITSVARFVRDMGDMPNTVAAVQDLLVDVDAILAAAGEGYECIRHPHDAGLVLAERVRLWQELERVVRLGATIGGRPVDDVLEKLTALDAKGTTE